MSFPSTLDRQELSRPQPRRSSQHQQHPSIGTGWSVLGGNRHRGATGSYSSSSSSYLLPLRRIPRQGAAGASAAGMGQAGPAPASTVAAVGVFGIPQRYIIVFLTFICTSVCYIERIGFSVAYTSTAIKDGVDQATKGWVLSAFYYGYASSQVPGSWAAQRFGGRRVLTVSFIFWSALCIFTPTDPGPILFLVAIRLAVGVAQGFIFPSIHTVLAQWIPPHEKSRSVSLTTSGMYFGAGAAMLGLPNLVAARGPESVFQLVAVMGIAWAAVWMRYATDPPGGATSFPAHAAPGGVGSVGGGAKGGGGVHHHHHHHHHLVGGQPTTKSPAVDGVLGPAGAPGLLRGEEGGQVLVEVERDLEMERERERERERQREKERELERKAIEITPKVRKPAKEGQIPWGKMMLSLPVWAIIVNNFTFHYALYVLMNWLPTYFDQGLHASLHSLGPGKSAPYFIMFLFSNVGGVVADHLITRRILSVTATRKVLNTLGFTTSAAALALMPVLSSVDGALFCSSVTLGACALARAGFAVNHMDIAPRYAGVVMGLSNTAGTVAGIVGVAATGLILEAAGGNASDTAGWRAVFLTPAVLCVLSSIVFCVFATGERIFD